MPNRLIKDSINESRGLTSCSFFAQDLFKRLITYADDYGRFNADPQIMVARLYPRELSVVSVEDLMDGLIELAGVDKIRFYTSKARKEVYGCFPNWSEHQRIRDSKKKLPDPDDTEVNDWYLRRFVPVKMKAEIIERDGFKCQECGKHIAETDDAYRLVKMATGTFHIDHIVPCSQGGRATMENLRLLCPKCNLSRKRKFNYDEIIEFSQSRRNSPRLAADCTRNPIQSESESESEIESEYESSNAPAPVQEELLSLVSFYEQGAGTFATPYFGESLTHFEGLLGYDVVKHGIEAAFNEGKTTPKYILAILRRYEQEGLDTLEKVERSERQFERDKQRRGKGSGTAASRSVKKPEEYSKGGFLDDDAV